MEEEKILFSIQMDITPMHPFPKDDGSAPIVTLEIFDTDPSSSIAALHQMRNIIDNDNSYLFYCSYIDAMQRTESDLDPEKFRMMMNDITRWFSVDFPVEIMEKDGPRNVNIVVTAPGYKFVLTSLNHFVEKENIETITNEMFENHLFDLDDLNN